ncbi:UNVERIFIED_CONTAM: chitin deacetylase, partial [Siphonaria sp. JEL0065]
MYISLITGLVAAVFAKAQTTAPPCLDTRYPSCTVVQMDIPDSYASYRVPSPPAVRKWTAFIKSLGDQTTYPWADTAPAPKTNDGGATGGAPNAKGAAWGTLDNKVTEVYSCPPNQWALTFDDGPILAGQTLALLKANNVVGTFFLVGSNVVNNATHAKLVQDLCDAGHQIALHSWTHRQISLQSTDEAISEIIFNILAIYNVIGKVPRYFRPPYSAIDDRIRNMLLSMGLRPAIWNLESLDGEIGGKAPGGIDQYDPRWDYFPGSGKSAGGQTTYNGFISLEHDITAAQIQVAESIIPFVAKSGYKSVFVNACDQILPNASFYLDDNSALTQFIKSIKLPLTASDLAVFTGSFPAIPAGGARRPFQTCGTTLGRVAGLGWATFTNPAHAANAIACKNLSLGKLGSDGNPLPIIMVKSNMNQNGQAFAADIVNFGVQFLPINNNRQYSLLSTESITVNVDSAATEALEITQAFSKTHGQLLSIEGSVANLLSDL